MSVDINLPMPKNTKLLTGNFIKSYNDYCDNALKKELMKPYGTIAASEYLANSFLSEEFMLKWFWRRIGAA